MIRASYARTQGHNMKDSTDEDYAFRNIFPNFIEPIFIFQARLLKCFPSLITRPLRPSLLLTGI